MFRPRKFANLTRPPLIFPGLLDLTVAMNTGTNLLLNDNFKDISCSVILGDMSQ